MKRLSILILVAFTTILVAFEEVNPVKSKPEIIMNSYIAIFEIPAMDISRAVKFYQNILEITLEEHEFPGMQMGLFPTEDQSNVGVILKAQDYIPSPNGITIYFNAGNDLQIILDKIEANGGEIIVPKTPHADGVGFFALFHDTEGNRIGLHSPN